MTNSLLGKNLSKQKAFNLPDGATVERRVAGCSAADVQYLFSPSLILSTLTMRGHGRAPLFTQTECLGLNRAGPVELNANMQTTTTKKATLDNGTASPTSR